MRLFALSFRAPSTEQGAAVNVNDGDDTKPTRCRHTGRDPTSTLIVLKVNSSSLSDLGCRSEKSAGRGQISPGLQRQYQDIGQKAVEICTVQVILQPTTPKSDRLLG